MLRLYAVRDVTCRVCVDYYMNSLPIYSDAEDELLECIMVERCSNSRLADHIFGGNDSLQTVAHTQLAQDGRYMGLDSDFADIQFIGNDFIGLALGQKV